MHKFHIAIYDAMTQISEKGKSSKITKEMGEYLALEGYIRVNDDERAVITEKGLGLLAQIEQIKQGELSRRATWVGLIVSGVLSLAAFIMSILVLFFQLTGRLK